MTQKTTNNACYFCSFLYFEQSSFCSFHLRNQLVEYVMKFELYHHSIRVNFVKWNVLFVAAYS
jgi:hypothetical protein